MALVVKNMLFFSGTQAQVLDRIKELNAGGPGSGRHKETVGIAEKHGYQKFDTPGTTDDFSKNNTLMQRNGGKHVVRIKNDGAWTYHRNLSTTTSKEGSNAGELDRHLTEVHKGWFNRKSSKDVQAGGPGSGRHKENSAMGKTATDHGYNWHRNVNEATQYKHPEGHMLTVNQDSSFTHKPSGTANSKTGHGHAALQKTLSEFHRPKEHSDHEGGDATQGW